MFYITVYLRGSELGGQGHEDSQWVGLSTWEADGSLRKSERLEVWREGVWECGGRMMRAMTGE